MASLNLAINAKDAETGADKYERATDKTKRASGDAARGMDTLDGSMADVGKTMAGIAVTGAALGVALAVRLAVPVVNLAKEFVNLASSQQEADSKFAAVFKDSAPDATAALEEIQSATGRSARGLVDMASSIQDLLVPMGLARDIATGFSTDLVGLAVDLGSFGNRETASVVNDIASAISGQSAAVRKYGINLTEAEVKQEAYRSGIAKIGRELTNAEKVQARINILFAATTDAQGDAARTIDSYANTIANLGLELDDLKGNFGVELSQSIVALIDDLGGVEGVSEKVALGFTAVEGAALLAFDIVESGADILSDFSDASGGAAQAQDVLARSFDSARESYRDFLDFVAKADAFADGESDAFARSERRFEEFESVLEKSRRNLTLLFRNSPDSLSGDLREQFLDASVTSLERFVEQEADALGIFKDRSLDQIDDFGDAFRERFVEIYGSVSDSADGALDGLSDELSRAGDNVSVSLDSAAQAAERARAFAEEYDGAMSRLNLTLEEQITQADRAAGAQTAGIVSMQLSGELTLAQSAALLALTAREREQTIALAQEADAARIARAEIEALNAVRAEQNRDLNFASETANLLSDEQSARNALTGEIDSQTDAVIRQAESYNAWIDAQVEAGQLSEQQGASLRQQAAGVTELELEYARLQDTLAEYSETVAGVELGIGAVAGSFARAATSGQDFGDLLIDSLQRVLEQIIRTRLEAELLNAAFSIAGAFSSSATSGSGNQVSTGSASIDVGPAVPDFNSGAVLGGQAGALAGAQGRTPDFATAGGSGFGSDRFTTFEGLFDGNSRGTGAAASAAPSRDASSRVDVGGIQLHVHGVTNSDGFGETIPQLTRQIGDALDRRN